MYERRARKERCIGLFVDLSSAYDNVDIDKLVRIIRENRVLSENELDLLMGMYSRIMVKLGDSETGISNGVAQGSTLAPYLFAIYTKVLIKKMR